LTHSVFSSGRCWWSFEFYVCILGSNGTDLPAVQRISAHKTLQMAEWYIHRNGEQISSVVDILEKWSLGV
jgi:hypothetical protein